MVASEKALGLIKMFEGLELMSYKCPGDRWTIGYGHTNDVKANQKITKDKAEEFLKEDVKEVEIAINFHTEDIDLTQNQFDALTSFVYNVGRSAFQYSTMLSYIKLRKFGSAGNEFKRWVYSGGKKLRGLIRRREAEFELFIKPEIEEVLS